MYNPILLNRRRNTLKKFYKINPSLSLHFTISTPNDTIPHLNNKTPQIALKSLFHHSHGPIHLNTPPYKPPYFLYTPFHAYTVTRGDLVYKKFQTRSRIETEKLRWGGCVFDFYLRIHTARMVSFVQIVAQKVTFGCVLPPFIVHDLQPKSLLLSFWI